MAKARAAATAKPSTNGRADALIAKMKAARGYIYPEWEFAARQDPDFVETYNRIYELGLGEGKHVSAKVREFVAIALLAFVAASARGWSPTCSARSASEPRARRSSRCSRHASSPAARRPSIAGSAP